MNTWCSPLRNEFMVKSTKKWLYGVVNKEMIMWCTPQENDAMV